MCFCGFFCGAVRCGAATTRFRGRYLKVGLRVGSTTRLPTAPNSMHSPPKLHCTPRKCSTGSVPNGMLSTATPHLLIFDITTHSWRPDRHVNICWSTLLKLLE